MASNQDQEPWKPRVDPASPAGRPEMSARLSITTVPAAFATRFCQKDPLGIRPARPFRRRHRHRTLSLRRPPPPHSSPLNPSLGAGRLYEYDQSSRGTRWGTMTSRRAPGLPPPLQTEEAHRAAATLTSGRRSSTVSWPRESRRSSQTRLPSATSSTGTLSGCRRGQRVISSLFSPASACLVRLTSISRQLY